jgi:hypothetical protein
MVVLVSLYILQMNYKQLLNRSKNRQQFGHMKNESFYSIFLFEKGALWMKCQLDKSNYSVLNHKQWIYTVYGLIKYMLSLFLSLLSTIFLHHIHPMIIPFSIIVFYFVEVHFAFLFPLLIDGEKNPILKSLELTYKFGIIKLLFIVIPISFTMMIGLTKLKNPLENWYLGCMSILILYENEIRNR